jgi:CDP-4-dehydro-6-deoxyglucose reductase
MALIPWRTATVIGIENETPDTRRFRLLMDGMDHFEFEPGQFITLDLPIHEKPNKRWRSYSIASFPDGSNEIELLIVLNPEGLGTNYLFNEIQIGSQLTYRGPQGVFVLPKVLDKTLFLICTGTGIAPFRSMVQNILRKKIPHQGINLIYGCRKKNNLMYLGIIQPYLERYGKGKRDTYMIFTRRSVRIKRRLIFFSVDGKR